MNYLNADELDALSTANAYALNPLSNAENVAATLAGALNRLLAESWQEQMASALECFWNASLEAVHPASDPTANAVMHGMVEGFAAMARDLRASRAAAPKQSQEGG